VWIDARGRHVGFRYLAREGVQKLVAEQIVQHGIDIAQQPFERAGEARELGNASGKQQTHEVETHVSEEPLFVRCAAVAIRPAQSAPFVAQTGTRAEEG
jgi:hypothetical protein